MTDFHRQVARVKSIFQTVGLVQSQGGRNTTHKLAERMVNDGFFVHYGPHPRIDRFFYVGEGKTRCAYATLQQGLSDDHKKSSPCKLPSPLRILTTHWRNNACYRQKMDGRSTS